MKFGLEKRRGEREYGGREGSLCQEEGRGGMGSLLGTDLGQVLLQTVREEMGRVREEGDRREARRDGS